MFKTIGVIIGAFLLLQGCSGSSVKQQKPSVTSEPSGAMVYANGQELGVTPLHQNLYKVFPASWNKLVLQATGALIVKKDGCKDFILNVNDYILSEPIHAKLECNGVNTPVTKTPKVTEKATSIQSPNKESNGSTEKRLSEVEGLYKKGVITRDEYQAIRKRILNEL